METSTRRQRLGTAHVAVGLWMLVAALVACVTWPGPKDVERVDLAAASLPVVGLVGAYLSITAIIHLGIGMRLRQGLGLSHLGILLLFADHLALLALVGKISLSNPSSPVYLTGSEIVLAVLVASALVSLTAGLLLWFVLPDGFPQASQADSTAKPLGWGGRMLTAGVWLHLPITLGLLNALWQLDQQPLMLVK